MFMHKLIRVSTEKQMYTLGPTKPRCRVGRRRTFNDCIITQPQVSRTHCIFTFDPDKKSTFLTALETSCGTFLNGKLVDSNSCIPLNSGDLIGLGDAADADLQILFIIDTDVEVVYESIPNPVQGAPVKCKNEVKKEEYEDGLNGNDPHNDLRVRSVETLTDENSSSRFVDLLSNARIEEVIVKPEIQYDDPSNEDQESSVDHFAYSTEDFINVEEDNFEETGETFEESDLKFKLQLQKQDVLTEYYLRLKQGREQVVDVITLSSGEEEDDYDDNDEISIVWRRLKPDQDKLVKFTIKTEVEDESEVEEVDYVEGNSFQVSVNQEIEEEQTSNIHDATTSDESSSTSSARKQKKLFRERSRSSGRRQRLPSSSDDESSDNAKPKVFRRSRLDDFRKDVISKKQQNQHFVEASDNKRRTRSMSRGTGTEFLMLPNDYKEQPRRSRSKSNLKSRSKSREKQSCSKPKQRPSRSKSRRQSHRKSSPTTAKENVQSQRRTRSMTRNEKTEFVSLPQDYKDSKSRSASHSRTKLPVPEEEDTSSKVAIKKSRGRKSVPDASMSKDFKERSSRNDEKPTTSHQADSKKRHSSIERRTRSISQSSTKSKESKSKKPSEQKISSHASEKPTRKRTRSQSKREEEENQRKKPKSASKDETTTSSNKSEGLLEMLFGDNDVLSTTSTEAPLVQEQFNIREEISNTEPEVVSPRTINDAPSTSYQSESDLEASKTASSKRIQVIDALPLTKRLRRLSSYSSSHRTDDEEAEPDEREDSSKKLEEPTQVSAPKKLSEKEKAEARSKKKEYKIEEKRRHQKYPWAKIPGRKTCGPIGPTMSNTEKKEIQNIRKESLAQIATDNQNVEVRQRTTPRVKVCEKSRGEKLCEDMNAVVKKVIQKFSPSDNNKENDKQKESNKRKESEQSPLMTNFLRSILKKKSDEVRRTRPKKVTFSENNDFELLRQEEKKRSRDAQLRAIENESDFDGNQMLDSVTTQDDNGPSSPVIPDIVIPDPVVLNSIHSEQIVTDANLNRQDVTQENPVPVNGQSIILNTGANGCQIAETSNRKHQEKVHQKHHRSRSQSSSNAARQPIIKESGLNLIWKILQWNPRWLDDQKKLNFEPPLTNYDTMIPLSDFYENFNDYIEKMKPSILLEMWNHISKYYDTNASNRPPQKYFISRNENQNGKPYVEKEIPGQKNKVYVSMELKTLVSQSGYLNETHLQKNSLAIFNYKATETCKLFLFCYVTDVKRTVIRSPSDYDARLKRVCTEPYAIVTLSVMMKKSSIPISENQLEVFISRIGPIRPFIKTWESIHNLIAHPTLCTILDPTRIPYRFTSQNVQSHSRTLSNIINVADEKDLDKEQQHAVLEAKRIFLERESRILVIDGLPGTGKSQVVVRIAAELFADGFKKGKSKIVICGPTDSAVDELASRLIVLNRKLSTDDKFKLIRIGETSDKTKDDVKKIQLRTCAEQMNETGKHNGVIRELNKKIGDLEKFLKNTGGKVQRYKEMRERLDSFRAQRKAMLCDPNAKEDILADEHLESLIKKKETKILMKADIILCTLESCTSEEMESVLSNCKEHVICIIDNASRCIEPQTLTPLSLGIRSLILVGNSEQYAIAHSSNAMFLGLKRSLFTRIVQLSPENVITLKTQYKTTMAALRPFNEYYCDGKIEFSKAPNVMKSLRPYLILDHNGIEGTDQNEAFIVRKLVHAIWSTMDQNKPLTIGVIAHKDDLAMEIKREIFENIASFHETLIITVETYEKFENQERDVIIVASAIKFLMNDLYVALTRARQCLYLCANFSSPILRFVFSMQNLLEDAKTSKTYEKLDAKLDSLDIKTQISHYQF